MDNLNNSYISIGGIIGVGKSTLAKNLGSVLNIPVYYEEVGENPYLEDFYKDMKKYAFNLQIYVLKTRYNQQQLIGWNNKGGIQDRTIYEDLIFQKMLYKSGILSERDYNTCISLFKTLSRSMIRPNFIIYLDTSPEVAYYRIHELRKREMEKGITMEYLTKLKVEYDEFMQNISKIIPVISIKYDKFSDPQMLVNKIKEVYNNINNITYINV